MLPTISGDSFRRTRISKQPELTLDHIQSSQITDVNSRPWSRELDMKTQLNYWHALYESACREPNRRLRLQLIMETQKAMLEQAWLLEQRHGSDEECRELERAAKALRRIKLASQFN